MYCYAQFALLTRHRERERKQTKGWVCLQVCRLIKTLHSFLLCFHVTFLSSTWIMYSEARSWNAFKVSFKDGLQKICVLLKKNTQIFTNVLFRCFSRCVRCHVANSRHLPSILVDLWKNLEISRSKFELFILLWNVTAITMKTFLFKRCFKQRCSSHACLLSGY